MNPTKPTKKRTRDLTKAVTLRPREVYELYGLHPSMVCRLCTSEDPEIRLPSTMIPGRKGSRGVRLINHDDLRAYIERRKAT